MILLLLTSLLLIFVSVGAGLFVCRLLQQWFKVPVTNDLVGSLLTGLALSSTWFNLISYFSPVNYLSLVPLILLSAWQFNQEKHRIWLKEKWLFLQELFLELRNLLLAIPLLLLFGIYWVISPINYDSGDYHYLSILYYEKYKVIPGLANVHGRLGFNPVSFIIGSAYSFTGLFGQSIYPLNGVVVLFFIVWLTRKMLSSKNFILQIVYFLLLFLYCRPLLANVSSPSSEPLVITSVSYSLLTIAENQIRGRNSLQYNLLPIIILVFAITAKLSALPALLVLPLVFLLLPVHNRKVSVLLKLAAIATVLLLPWLGRNVILSGYPLYPLPVADVFNIDWKVPREVIMLDYTYVKYFPNFFEFEYRQLKALSFIEWFRLWLSKHIPFGRGLDLSVLIIALLSPLYWLFFIKTKEGIRNLFLLWLVVYINVWIWLANSPEYRFGVIYLALAFAIPFIAIARRVSLEMPPVILPLLMLIFVFYYSVHAFKKESTYSFTVTDMFLYPLKDHRYFKNNDTSTFNYTTLNNGLKLYLSDEAHDCINAPLPCMSWRYGEIEMRGATIEAGFRNRKNEVKKYFPFVE